MTLTTDTLTDLEAKAGAGEAFTGADAARLLASPDLVRIGMIGDAARRQVSGDVMTYGRVCDVPAAGAPDARSDAGEVRLVGAPSSIDDACARVRAAAAIATGAVFTGFSAADLFARGDHDHAALTAAARRLAADGLEAIAEVSIDSFTSDDEAIAVVRALVDGGLGVFRLTIDHAAADVRVALCLRAAAIQAAVGAVRAFAPLPRLDPSDTPSTGYDDVRTIAVARLVCRGIPNIQVDWPMYGPKLAQVALAYGANDVDGIAAADVLQLGPRRAPKEDIERQIRAAGGQPIERNGRYERVS